MNHSPMDRSPINLLYACTDPGIPVDGTKGASIHVRAMCRAFAAEGHSVHIAAARIDAPALVAASPIVLDARSRRLIERASGDRAGALRAQLAARALALSTPAWRAAGIDAVYERYSLFGSGGQAVARALGVPHVLEVNAPLTREAARYRALPWPRRARAIERDVLTGADAVVAVSTPLAEWLAEVGVDPARILVLPNGVDADAMAAAAPERHAVRARLRLADRRVIGFVGSIRPWHGVGDVLDAFARVAADDPAACLLIVGDGPALPTLEARAVELGLRHRVRFTGSVPHEDVPALLAACDVAVAPYAADAEDYFSPIKLFEYLAAGLPTVAADIPPVRAVVDDGRTARLYPAGDVAAMASALAAVLAAPQAARAMGAAGRADVIARHTWRHNAQAVLARLARLSIHEGSTEAGGATGTDGAGVADAATRRTSSTRGADACRVAA